MSFFEKFNETELAVLKARAQRFATVANQDQNKKTFTALEIMVRDERYALPIEAIEGVLDNMPITPVPCAPNMVAGIANVRGRIISVWDLALLLNVPGEYSTSTNKLFLVSEGRNTLAFRVEALGSVQTYHPEQVEPLPPSLDIEHAHCLQGTLPNGAILLSIDALLKDHRLQQ